MCFWQVRLNCYLGSCARIFNRVGRPHGVRQIAMEAEHRRTQAEITPDDKDIRNILACYCKMKHPRTHTTDTKGPGLVVSRKLSMFLMKARL